MVTFELSSRDSREFLNRFYMSGQSVQYQENVIKVTSFKFEYYELVDDQYFCKYEGCNHTDGFKTLGGCKNHQLQHHTKDSDKLFLCNYCDKKFDMILSGFSKEKLPVLHQKN